MSAVTLCTLPTELLYHLLEYLDVSTVLFSFRFVCKRFQSIVNSYDRYKLDLRLISKVDFDRLCYIITPEKISSMILANDVVSPYQIRTFLSRFSIDRFSQLRSLNLIKIEEANLFTILMNISSSSLKSLTINCAAWDTFSHTLHLLLSSMIAKSHLEKLDLNCSCQHLNTISMSPLPLTLKSLRLKSCTFQEYCTILRHASNLESLTLTDCLMYSIDDTIYQPSDVIGTPKLNSFTYGPGFMRMKELLILLSCVPRLNYLKLILWTDSLDSVIDGKKWEDFISEHLLFLDHFEFFFDDTTDVEGETLNIQSYVQPFQTPFWLEQHRWYIVCDYMKRFAIIRLYSLPICNELFLYYPNSSQISCSTLIPEDNQMELTQHVHDINLYLNEITEADEIISNKPLFQRVSRLSLILDDRQPYTSFRVLRTIIDFSSLLRLSMQIPSQSFIRNSALTDYLTAILKETSSIHSLKVTHLLIEEYHIDVDIFCSIVPISVKHLQMSIATFDQAKAILEQLHRLFSVTFYSTNQLDDLPKWIDFKRKNSICRQNKRYIQIWLGKLIEHDREESSMKRVFRRICLKHSI